MNKLHEHLLVAYVPKPGRGQKQSARFGQRKYGLHTHVKVVLRWIIQNLQHWHNQHEWRLSSWKPQDQGRYNINMWYCFSGSFKVCIQIQDIAELRSLFFLTKDRAELCSKWPWYGLGAFRPFLCSHTKAACNSQQLGGSRHFKHQLCVVCANSQLCSRQVARFLPGLTCLCGPGAKVSCWVHPL